MSDYPTIQIDGVDYRPPSWRLTGREILALAGKTHEDYVLFRLYRDRRRRVEPWQALNLESAHSSRRFRAAPRLRRQG